MRQGYVLLYLVFMCLGLFVLRLPLNLAYTHYLWGDAGSCLAAAQLVSTGKVPWVDFSYNYGCASLWISQAWFYCFGYTPVSYLLLNVLCALLVCWGIARLVALMQWDRKPSLIIFLCLPYVVGFIWFNVAHALETILLLQFLVEFVKRRYAMGLCYATLALFCKPALAFFAGFFLLVEMVSARNHRPLAAHLKSCCLAILPSLILLLVFSLIVTSVWSLHVLQCSLIPIGAMKSYTEHNFGLLGQGVAFWLPQTKNLWLLLEYYLLTPAGIWIFSTFYVVYRFCVILLRWRQRRLDSIPERLVFICGLLQLCFLLFLFGGMWAWTYTTYLLIFGTLTTWNKQSPVSTLRFVGITFVLVLSYTAQARSIASGWSEQICYSDVHYLFMPQTVHQELHEIEALALHHRVLMLQQQGAPGLVLNHVQSLPVWFYLRSTATAIETNALYQAIDSADILVVPNNPLILDMLSWEDIALRLKGFPYEKRTEHFLFLARKDVAW